MNVMYGGTKAEMERLLADAQKLTGVKYDITNLNDVYSAIHVIQTELGITGTTAKEASSTVSGSFKAMSSSFKNLMGSMALGQNIKPALKSLLETTSTFLFNNLLPMVRDVFFSIPPILMELAPLLLNDGVNMLVSLSEGFVQGFPTMMATALDFVQNFATWLSQQAPIVIQKGFEMLSNLVSGIINALPTMIQKLPLIISTFANIINDNFPVILKKGFDLLVQFIQGILSAIPTLIQNIPQIIKAIFDTIMAFNWLNLGKSIMDFFGNGIKSMKEFIKGKGGEIAKSIWDTLTHLPQTLWNLGKSIIQKMGSAITNTTGTVRGAIKGVFDAIVNGVKSLPSKMLGIGKNVVKGLWNGINEMKNWVVDKIKGFADSILGGIKDFFGIHSPSRVFELEVGKMLPLGMAEGIEKNIKPVDEAIQKLNNETMGVIDTNLEVTTRSYQTVSNDSSLAIIIDLLKLLIDKEPSDDSNILERILLILNDFLPMLSQRQIVLDTGVLAAQLAPKVDEEMGKIEFRKGR